MRYMCLIYSDEGAWARMSKGDNDKVMQEFMAFTASIVKSGHHRAGDPLEPTSTATTVRSKDGKAMIIDGPFAETKEQLGGYYIIEAANLDEALKIAQRIPSVNYGGSIEVLPIVEIPRRA